MATKSQSSGASHGSIRSSPTHSTNTQKNPSTCEPKISTTIMSYVGFSAKTLAILAIVASFVIGYYIHDSNTPKTNSNYNVMVEETLKSLLRIENRVQVNTNLNVAVGFGSCLDLFVSSKQLITTDEPPSRLVHHESIQNQDQLNELFGYFFTAGAAAERYIDNSSFFDELVSRANKAGSKVRKAVGGNAAVMAKRFVMEGVDRVLLGTQMSQVAKSEFSEKLILSGPIVDRDDIHISIEYPAGERWGHYTAPRANRLIIHNDNFNPIMESVNTFIDRLNEMRQLDLLVIGGLQMMDNFPIPIDVRRSRLEQLGQALSRLPSKKTLNHLELASFTEVALLKSIEQLVIPHVDSLGMNEQELPNLLTFLTNGNVNLKSEAYPRVATALDQTRQLFATLQKHTHGRLSRIHVHTLAFQAIVTKVKSPWKNSLSSAVKAALTAHRYTCGSHEVDVAKAKLIMDESYTTSRQESRRRIVFNSKHPVVCWPEDLPYRNAVDQMESVKIEICVAPVLVCTKVKQTAGAGDNVSAAGLIYQL